VSYNPWAFVLGGIGGLIGLGIAGYTQAEQLKQWELLWKTMGFAANPDLAAAYANVEVSKALTQPSFGDILKYGIIAIIVIVIIYYLIKAWRSR
jgi:ABC-type antimicrobial peptide transport system permease subunit